MVHFCEEFFRMAPRVARWFVFHPKKSQFGSILKDFRKENAGLFYGHLEYFSVV
jgi:hypothetical protein